MIEAGAPDEQVSWQFPAARRSSDIPAVAHGGVLNPDYLTSTATP